MKKIILPISVLALSVGFLSCEDDDEESVNFGGRHLTKFSYYIYNSRSELVDSVLAKEHPNEWDSLGNPMGWNTVVDSMLKEIEFGYDSKGRINKQGAYYIFEYKGSKLTYGNKEELSVEYYNSSGYITNFKYVMNNDELNERFEYDQSWHILSEEGYSTHKFITENNESIVQTDTSKITYEWEDGNIVKINYNLGQSPINNDYPYIFKYTNEEVTIPIENKVNCPFYSTSALAMGINMAWGYRRGVKCKNLPVSIISNTGVETKLVWTLDNDGYPSGLRFGDVTCKFAWE